jgi:uncharacterized tellurite resistance protein B-like protein
MASCFTYSVTSKKNEKNCLQMLPGSVQDNSISSCCTHNHERDPSVLQVKLGLQEIQNDSECRANAQIISMETVRERAALVYQMFQSYENEDGSVSKEGAEKLKYLLKGCFDIEPEDLEPESTSTIALDGIVIKGDLIEEMLNTGVRERAVILYRLTQLDKNGDGTVSATEMRNFQKIVQELVDKTLSLFTTTGVVSALLMSLTISVQLQTQSMSPSNATLSVLDEDTALIVVDVYSTMMMVSSCTTTLAVWFSTRWYQVLTSFCADQEDQLWFIANTNVAIPNVFMITGFFSALLSVPIAMFLLHGVRMAIISTGLVVLTVIPIRIFESSCLAGLDQRFKSKPYIVKKTRERDSKVTVVQNSKS